MASSRYCFVVAWDSVENFLATCRAFKRASYACSTGVYVRPVVADLLESLIFKAFAIA